MKLSKIGLNTLIYTIYYFGACTVVMLVESLFMFFADKLVVLAYPAVTLMRFIIYTLGVPALIGFLGYKEGYREAACSVGETVAAGILTVLIPHLLFAMLFRFQSFAAGGVRQAVGLIQSGMNVTEESVLPTRKAYGLFLLTYAVYGLVYTAVLALCKYFGAKRRIDDRAELQNKNA